MTRILFVAATCLLASAVACGGASDSGKTGSAAPGAGGGVAAAPINANCPMMGDPIESKGGTVSYKGQTIGFCCPGCSGKFEALDDAGKVAALEKTGTKLPQ